MLVKCPYCCEEIKEGARKCKHCHEWISELRDSDDTGILAQVRDKVGLAPESTSGIDSEFFDRIWREENEKLKSKANSKVRVTEMPPHVPPVLDEQAIEVGDETRIHKLDVAPSHQDSQINVGPPPKNRTAFSFLDGLTVFFGLNCLLRHEFLGFLGAVALIAILRIVVLFFQAWWVQPELHEALHQKIGGNAVLVCVPFVYGASLYYLGSFGRFGLALIVLIIGMKIIERANKRIYGIELSNYLSWQQRNGTGTRPGNADQ